MLRLLAAITLLAAPLAAQAPAWTATRELARGVVVADSDMVAPNGAAPSAPKPVGYITRRIVRAGEPLREPAVAPPTAVTRGDQVALVLTRGTIRLTLRGTALGDAAVGRRVLVRVDTKRRFEGTVTGPGTVQIDS